MASWTENLGFSNKKKGGKSGKKGGKKKERPKDRKDAKAGKDDHKHDAGKEEHKKKPGNDEHEEKADDKHSGKSDDKAESSNKSVKKEGDKKGSKDKIDVEQLLEEKTQSDAFGVAKDGSPSRPSETSDRFALKNQIITIPSASVLETLKSYPIEVYGSPVMIDVQRTTDFVKLYKVSFPEISRPTEVVLETIKDEILREARINPQDIFDSDAIKRLSNDFSNKAHTIISEKLPQLNKSKTGMLICHLLCDMIGLGPIEIPLNDPNLEEVVVNTSREPVWVYHKKFGWLKTNITISSEPKLQNYANIIARRVGRQITTLEPLLDAHLTTGDRANATLFPISSKGNTLTIRKFSRRPWTITDFISNGTINLEVAAFIWLAMQYEMNVIVAGGTSSGKTSLLNSLMPFIQSNQRIISIEDTRELRLPGFLHWVPLTTRLPNPEGKGEVSMLNLMINSLRMRPDRIVVGEIRRADQAEVLFEAMHTGHSVYATLHADTADQVIRRMTNPPINIPDVMMESLHLILVQRRDRRKGIRRTYQVAELLPAGDVQEKRKSNLNILYRCKPDGTITAHDPCVRVIDELRKHTGMTDNEFVGELKEKMSVLDYMVKKNVKDIDSVGRTIAEYYSNKENLFKMMAKG
jgi:flagellar protein FlaI